MVTHQQLLGQFSRTVKLVDSDIKYINNNTELTSKSPSLKGLNVGIHHTGHFPAMLDFPVSYISPIWWVTDVTIIGLSVLTQGY